MNQTTVKTNTTNSEVPLNHECPTNHLVDIARAAWNPLSMSTHPSTSSMLKHDGFSLDPIYDMVPFKRFECCKLCLHSFSFIYRDEREGLGFNNGKGTWM
jgi:hypothetical protein